MTALDLAQEIRDGLAALDRLPFGQEWITRSVTFRAKFLGPDNIRTILDAWKADRAALAAERTRSETAEAELARWRRMVAGLLAAINNETGLAPGGSGNQDFGTNVAARLKSAAGEVIADAARAFVEKNGGGE